MEQEEAPTSTALSMAIRTPEKEKPVASRFRRVCVFCGSSPGKKAAYQLAAVQLGQQLVERGIGLVYGGGSVGLMGLVSRAVHGSGGHVTGVVPKSLLPRELIGETPGEVLAVSGMHQRKAEMARCSDAFVALPGGYGTLEELLEVITWAQLGIHDKPVGLLNVDGYYDSLLAFIDRAVDEGFIVPAARHIIVAARTPCELLAGLEEYVPATGNGDLQRQCGVAEVVLGGSAGDARRQYGWPGHGSGCLVRGVPWHAVRVGRVSGAATELVAADRSHGGAVTARGVSSGGRWPCPDLPPTYTCDEGVG